MKFEQQERVASDERVPLSALVNTELFRLPETLPSLRLLTNCPNIIATFAELS